MRTLGLRPRGAFARGVDAWRVRRALTHATLLRVVGTRRLAATIFNTVVGAGIFALPGVIAGLSGTAAPIAYLACTGAILLVALSYASAGSRVSKAGGSYAYIAAGLGPMVGAIGGVLAWLADTLAAASVAAGLMSALGAYLPLAAAGIGRALCDGDGDRRSSRAINIRGVRQGATVVEGMTVAKLVPLLLFVLVGASLMTWDRRLMPTWPTVDVLGRTMLVLMFAFSGAETALSLSGEVDRPERTVPRALLMALAGISLLYSSVHIVAFGALGQGLATSTAAPLADAGAQTGGAVAWQRDAGGDHRVDARVLERGADEPASPAVLAGRRRAAASVAHGDPSALSHAVDRDRRCRTRIVLAAALSGSFAVLVPLASVAILAVYLMVALSAAGHAAARRRNLRGRSRCRRPCRSARCCCRSGCCRARGLTS